MMSLKSRFFISFMAAAVSLNCLGQVNREGFYEWHYGRYIHHTVTSSNGLVLGFVSISTNRNIANPVTAPLEITFSNYPALSTAIFIPKDRYVCELSLYDPSNQPVRITKRGAQFRLEDALPWKTENVRQRNGQVQAVFRHEGTVKVFYTDQNGKEAQGSYLADGWTQPVKFPKISDLFEADKPGKYKLFIEMQVFLKEGTKIELVRFPPLKLPVEVPGNGSSNIPAKADLKTNAEKATSRQ